MLITFTTEHGALVIRSEDLRRLEDGPEGQCIVGWTEGVDRSLCYSPILGTAAENRDRIMAEEATLIAAYEAAQRMAQTPPKARKAVNR